MQEQNKSELLADLFHALNQPLAAIHCTLELNLCAPREEQQYRDALAVCLEKVEEIAAWTNGIRELVQDEEADGYVKVSALKEIVREAVEHFAPIFEERRVQHTVEVCEEYVAAPGPERLRQTIFYLLDFALGAIGPDGRIEIAVKGDSNDSCRVNLQFVAALPDSSDSFPRIEECERRVELGRKLALAIARKNVELAGGGMEIQEDPRELRMKIWLARVEAPAQASDTAAKFSHFHNPSHFQALLAQRRNS